MNPAAGIAAHLILGPREEPFLEAMLESIGEIAGLLIVNDNSPDPSPHTATLKGSRFGCESRLIVDRAEFAGFAAARNRCLEIHAERSNAKWVAFIDADEVHSPKVRRVAERLRDLAPEYDFVDGYTWHFFGSFDYYTSIERRMMFFRFRPGVRWEGAVHERLTGLSGKRVAVPYVYAHYGHTLEPRRHAEKGRHYSSLGAPGNVLQESQLDDFDVAKYYAPVYPRLLKFRGSHPPAARETLARLRPWLRPHHELTSRMAATLPLHTKAGNVIRRYNYEMRWRGRLFGPIGRRLGS